MRILLFDVVDLYYVPLSAVCIVNGKLGESIISSMVHALRFYVLKSTMTSLLFDAFFCAIQKVEAYLHKKSVDTVK